MEDYWKCPREDIADPKELGFCVGGLDTSSTSDLTAFSIYSKTKKYVRTWFFIPGESAHQRSMLDGVDYETWVKNPKANLVFSGSKRIDREQILKKILELTKIYRIGAIAYDPWEGKVGIVQDLEKKGIRLIEFPQSYASMNAPTKQFEALIATQQLNVGTRSGLQTAARGRPPAA